MYPKLKDDLRDDLSFQASLDVRVDPGGAFLSRGTCKDQERRGPPWGAVRGSRHPLCRGWRGTTTETQGPPAPPPPEEAPLVYSSLLCFPAQVGLSYLGPEPLHPLVCGSAPVSSFTSRSPGSVFTCTCCGRSKTSIRKGWSEGTLLAALLLPLADLAAQERGDGPRKQRKPRLLRGSLKAAPGAVSSFTESWQQAPGARGGSLRNSSLTLNTAQKLPWWIAGCLSAQTFCMQLEGYVAIHVKSRKGDHQPAWTTLQLASARHNLSWRPSHICIKIGVLL
nr:uncharacterized protein LOC127491537 [Oryctolagus cuniculus]